MCKPENLWQQIASITWWICDIVHNIMWNLWGLRRFIKILLIFHRPLKSTLSPTLCPIIDIMTDSWVNSALFVLQVAEKMASERMVASWHYREFVDRYEAGYSVWKTLCYKTKISWFDFWQLRNNPAVFSFPKLPAVQLKMEMIYVPQTPADWQALQEGVVEPHCAMALLQERGQITGMLPLQGSGRFLDPKKLSCACLGMEENWPMIFSESQEEMHNPKGCIFPWFVPRGRWHGGLHIFIT